MARKKLDDLLDIAINVEIDSQKFYQDAANRTSDAKAKNFLNSLAEAEKTHERILKEIKDMKLYDGSIHVDTQMLDITQGAHSIEDSGIDENTTLEEIYQIAQKREMKAYILFQDMERIAPNKEILKLFTSLSKEEMAHYKSKDRLFTY